MQTFSYLQRSGDDERGLRLLFLFLLLYFFYEPLTTVYIYLPPLLAVASWKIFKSRSLKNVLLWALYLFIYEMDHSLPFLSTIVAVAAVTWILGRLELFIDCPVCLIVANTVLFYLLLAAVLFLMNVIFNTGFSVDLWLFGIYILLDLGILLLYEI